MSSRRVSDERIKVVEERISAEIAVLVPCYNEEQTIAKVVEDFPRVLPGAVVYVYDNNSTDRTVEVARQAGAVVCRETRQGKGYVVRRMFSDVDADFYILVDGDATYDAASAPMMLNTLREDKLDMVVGTRIEHHSTAYRLGHRTGNIILTGLVSRMFGKSFSDILSGYRVFSRRFVKSFPVLSSGFEIETELTVHALELELPVAEVPTPYFSRPSGSSSKLNTWRDGLRIFWMILQLYRVERPLSFFGIAGMLLALVSIGLAVPLLITFLQQGIVPRLPTAVLSTGLMLLAFLSSAVGFILDTVTIGRREAKRIAYLSLPAPTRPRVEAAAGSHQLS